MIGESFNWPLSVIELERSRSMVKNTKNKKMILNLPLNLKLLNSKLTRILETDYFV
jgi:hypothetical protein